MSVYRVLYMNITYVCMYMYFVGPDMIPTCSYILIVGVEGHDPPT